ncbi:MAG: ParB/RepB/Spo0J family partition protein, partial [Clostridia bacterium]|nr:ParB/RepB/Spo0J family partition protein [Clostridia bacterium]
MVSMIKGMTTGGERVRLIKISEIQPDPLKTRREWDDGALLQLKDSLHRHGILVPLTVRPGENGYLLISGERRLRAARELGFRDVPCVIFPADDRLCAEFSLIESMQRRELDMFDQARAINDLIEKVGLTREETARQLSCSSSCISNKLRLLRFDRDEREAIRRGGLTERHARAILRIPDKGARLAMIENVSKSGISVSETEEMVENAVNAALETFYGKKRSKNIDPSVDPAPKARLLPFPAPSVSSGAEKTTDRALICSSERMHAVNTLTPFENTLERAVRTLKL